jgi:hypothetical protein
MLNLLWIGQVYHSLESCLLSTTDAGTEVNSVIIGTFENKIYRIEYFIKTNQNWETVLLEIKSQFADKTDCLDFQSDGKGNWMTNGKHAEQFNGCIDIDISLTPFTNTLPINRLKLSESEKHLINVLYIDVLEQQTKPVRQRYTRLSETEYKYENVPNDFEAVITVDELGLVVNYPELFMRIATRESNYR